MTSKHSTLDEANNEVHGKAHGKVHGKVDVSRDLPRAAKLIVSTEDAGQRLDRFLTEHLHDLSRTRIQSLLDHGHARLNGAPAKRSHRVEAGDAVAIEIPPPPPMHAHPEAIALDILYSDEDLIVVNKPAGMVVHPGAGVKSGTMVNALLHEFGARGELSSIGGELRPGIVHRLDRETSGALLVARNDKVHRALSDQFRDRQIGKTYIALLHGRLKNDTGRIELPVSRDLHRRVRMTTRRREGRPARTDWRVRMRLPGYTFLEADLHTGRTHQIRVHFSALGHPVVGDTLYGAPAQPKAGTALLPPLGRNFLHAAHLRFLHPTTGNVIDVRAAMPVDLANYLRRLASASGAGVESIDAVLTPYL
ncbi:MAG TPA: RluA family pseudouridine synthase [Candidatus Acidoferrales bacterium]|nr:RluA family pseudouridine synthase [Candidatus Acidoferrales bacterium]